MDNPKEEILPSTDEVEAKADAEVAPEADEVDVDEEVEPASDAGEGEPVAA